MVSASPAARGARCRCVKPSGYADGAAGRMLTAEDLDGDGKVDIVAVGRATKNVRVYRNVGGK